MTQKQLNALPVGSQWKVVFEGIDEAVLSVVNQSAEQGLLDKEFLIVFTENSRLENNHYALIPRGRKFQLFTYFGLYQDIQSFQHPLSNIELGEEIVNPPEESPLVLNNKLNKYLNRHYKRGSTNFNKMALVFINDYHRQCANLMQQYIFKKHEDVGSELLDKKLIGRVSHEAWRWIKRLDEKLFLLANASTWNGERILQEYFGKGIEDAILEYERILEYDTTFRDKLVSQKT
jgi:hypothetical protein